MSRDSLTLEETNKIRISMGLKPLGPAPAPGGEGQDGEPMEVELDSDALAEKNFAERMEREKKEKEDKETKERIAKAQNRLALNAKLKGTSLGASAADDEDSALSWIRKAKKKAKELAKQREQAEKREREQEERDRIAYDENDLQGLKVAHDADDFKEGEEVILTLKDGRILDDEEDELQNVNLADDEAVKASKERKRKAKAQYTGYDDEEFDPEAIGEKREMLSQYDDEFMGGAHKVEGFRLGGAPQESRKKAKLGDGGFKDDGDETIAITVNRQLLNLDYAKNIDVSDYATEETGFKKPKKKKVKRSARRADDDDDPAAGPSNGDGDVDMKPRMLDREADENLVDDDDLQMALSRQRRKIAKKSMRLKPEEIAAQVAADHADGADEARDNANGQVTFDDTTEFVRNVTLETLIPVKREARARSASAAPVASSPIEQDIKPVIVKIETMDTDPVDGVEMDVEMEEGEAEIDDEEDEELAEMALRQGLSLEEMRLKMDRDLAEMKEEEDDDVMISKPAPTLSGGIAGALALLRQQGAIKAQTAEEIERERIQKERDLWLADHRRRVAKRELEKIKARGGIKDQAQREWENKMREQQEAREALGAYANYKPDVNIVYTDEFGRQMTKKEAWKSLSHKFHGKTSGRMKTELRLRRIEEERKALSTGSRMADSFAKRQEVTGEAYMTLSIGNRSAVPMGDAKGKGKGKAKPTGPKVLG